MRKNKRAAPTKEQELLYVQVSDPNSVRRDVLTSVKDVLGSLKRYEHFMGIRQQKEEAVRKLKRVVDELAVLNRKLRSALPKAPGIPVPAREKEEEMPGHRVVRAKSKLELLEHELADIESRLGSLE